jgi:hypothetical protein
MEIAVAAVAAQGHEVLINYFIGVLAMSYRITRLIALCLAVELHAMLRFGFFSVTVLILNAEVCVLTNVR